MITHNFDPIIRQLRKNARDFSVPLKQWYAYMLTQTARTFRALGKKNAGAYRGVSWPWFAPVNVWGKKVPAEGNRVRHSFAVVSWNTGDQKRKRPARHYVSAGSKLLQDTGLLRNSALGVFSVTKDRMDASTPVKYANRQNKLRPFVFITEQDGDKLTKMINSHLVS